jgi:signal transduction histidine kinase
MILAEAKRCKGIVGGLLDFARQNKVERKETVVAELVAEAARIAAAQHPDAPARIVTAVAADAGVACLDSQQMLQVLLNLVKNAVEAMPCGGAVTIGAGRRPNGELAITVSDEGRGIAPDAMNKLFSPFYTTKPVGHGTGLGLPICYGIVKMHRGQITARNNPGGKGATFEITLPAEELLHV